MQVASGTVVSEKIILDDLAFAEVDRGEMIPGEEFFNQLRVNKLLRK
jgi:hypothetical protein